VKPGEKSMFIVLPEPVVAALAAIARRRRRSLAQHVALVLENYVKSRRWNESN